MEKAFPNVTILVVASRGLFCESWPFEWLEEEVQPQGDWMLKLLLIRMTAHSSNIRGRASSSLTDDTFKRRQINSPG